MITKIRIRGVLLERAGYCYLQFSAVNLQNKMLYIQLWELFMERKNIPNSLPMFICGLVGHTALY